MKSQISTPRSALIALGGGAEDYTLERIASAISVRPAELLLYHEGIESDPGFARRFQLSRELMISETLGRSTRDPFRFRSAKEFRWFVTKNHMLWRHCGEAFEQTNWYPDNWMRGLFLDSYLDYLGEIAACLQEQNKHAVRMDSWLREQARQAELEPGLRIPPKTTLWMETLSRLAGALTGHTPKEHTLHRWLERGIARRKKPGWHLTHIGISLINTAATREHLATLRGASLRCPCGSRASEHTETWKRLYAKSRKVHKDEYWGCIHTWIGTISRRKTDLMLRKLHEALDRVEICVSRVKEWESSPMHLAIGPFRTMKDATAARTRLRRRKWKAGDIRERGRPFRNRGYFVLLERSEPGTMEEWVDRNIPALDKAVGSLLGRKGEVGILPTGPQTKILVGPYPTSEECRRDLRILKKLGFDRCKVEPGTKDAEQRFHWPAGREQFLPFHRSD